jgi:hypothetical protein
MSDPALSQANFASQSQVNAKARLLARMKDGFGTQPTSSLQHLNNTPAPVLVTQDDALQVLEAAIDEIAPIQPAEQVVEAAPLPPQPVQAPDTVVVSQPVVSVPVPLEITPEPDQMPQLSVAAAVPQAVEAAAQADIAATHQAAAMAAGGLASKESAQPLPVEAAPSIQYVEEERTPEISPEVEAYLQKVEEHADQQLHEVVIGQHQDTVTTQPFPAQPVVVLPMTEEEELIGRTKKPRYSVRWLVELSHKLIKVFSGKIIYRQAESPSS